MQWWGLEKRSPIRLKRPVALKLLPPAMAQDPERLERFRREAEAVAALNHPNIVTLYSIESSDTATFLVMELVKGESLDTQVTPGGLPLTRAVELAIQLSSALTAAHEQGVVHRDLKPANLMVTGEGWLKVLDFGIAKLVEEESAPETARTMTMQAPLSGEGQVLGTVPYMAPEQVRAEAVDTRTDLFAFGIILYELVTGQRPFTGATFADVASAILRD
ncbi:MAG: serine/threonine-protein kinase, partial [Thermoanaerobaculia bacterium]